MVLEAKTSLSGVKDTLAAGSVVLQGITPEQAKNITVQFGLDLTATKATANVKQHEVTLPRTAIYHSWINTQDEGWVRFTFDQRGIPYTSIEKDDLKAGDLRSKYDVIVIPKMRGTGSDFIHEIDKKFGPLPYTKTPEFPSHGFPDSTPDMTGGPGFDGMNELRMFVEAGGVLVTLDNTSAMIAETGLTRELDKVETPGLYHPGSIVNVKVRKSDSPIVYGFPEVFPIFKGISPLLQTKKYNRDMMVLQYGTKSLKEDEEYNGPIMGLPDRKTAKETVPAKPKKEEPYVLSGMVRNEQTIVGHGGIFNVPVGAGRLVAFTFNPLHRYINLHDAPMVWNILINWNRL